MTAVNCRQLSVYQEMFTYVLTGSELFKIAGSPN